jgi:type VI secretion system protein ImpH
MSMTEAERIAQARRAGFYPLLVLLERLHPDRAPWGTALPAEEGIRFRHDPSLAFSTGDVGTVERRKIQPDPEDITAEAKEVVEITTTFLGLTGAVSPLPSYFAEEVLHEEGDSRQREFLDIFHHRVVSLFYRARAKYDVPNSRHSAGADAWSRRLLELLGYDSTGARPERFGVPAWRLLRLGAVLAERDLTAPALEAVLADLLDEDLGDAGVSVEQFVGTWAEVAEDQLSRLGRSCTALGRDLLLGRRVFDRAGKFRIVIGPLSRDGYARFSESGGPLRRIAELVATVASDHLEYEVVLWLSREAAPSMQLTSTGKTRLGKNAWLGGQAREARVRVQVPSPAGP